jgi:hypothetical protein
VDSGTSEITEGSEKGSQREVLRAPLLLHMNTSAHTHRRAARKNQKKPTEVVQKKKPTKLERVRYDPVTGEKITAKMAAPIDKKQTEQARPAQQQLAVQVCRGAGSLTLHVWTAVGDDVVCVCACA